MSGHLWLSASLLAVVALTSLLVRTLRKRRPSEEDRHDGRGGWRLGAPRRGREARDPLVEWVTELRETGTERFTDPFGSCASPGPSRPAARRDSRRPAGADRPLFVPSASLRTAPRAAFPEGVTAWPVVNVAPATAFPAVARPVSNRIDAAGVLSAPEPVPGAVVPSGPAAGSAPDASGPEASASDEPPTRWRLSTRQVLVLTGLAGAGGGVLLGGPVAAVALGAYGTLTVRAVLRHRRTRRNGQARRRRLDQLGGLAADLRAGLPVAVATLGFAEPASATWSSGAHPDAGRSGTGGSRISGADPRPSGPVPATPVNDSVPPAPGRSVTTSRARLGTAGHAPARHGTAAHRLDAAVRSPDRLGRLTRAAVRLADRTGAPLADLVERIEADARATDRGLAAAAAQAAGARATALLLAALPLGGIGLGYGIGVDPVQVLLHTPVGGGCAVAAVALQAIGLLWAERLGAPPSVVT
ncbi:tight adherence protein B [Micromonospora nigra]|uniref:Tight adherence protein B n=1 Tax=Micromonospora nigra TaxID=145857 RepID=A0A1C6S526_9ACTN|nr:tight adherence protein B [Micromonospora nigra]